MAAKLLFVYIFVPIAVAIGVALAVYFLVFRSGTKSTATPSGDKLPEPNFTSRGALALGSSGEVLTAATWSADNQNGFFSVFVDGNFRGSFFIFDVQSGDTAVHPPIDHLTGPVDQVESAIVVYNTDKDKSEAFQLIEGRWDADKAFELDGKVGQMYKDGDTVYSMQIAGSNQIAVYAQQAPAGDNQWTQVIRTPAGTSIPGLVAACVASSTGDIYAIDHNFKLYRVNRIGSSWNPDVPQGLADVWANVSLDPSKNLACLRCEPSGNLFAVEMTRQSADGTTFEMRGGTYNRTSGDMPFMFEQDKVEDVASCSVLPDFRMLAFYMPGSGLSVYRTDPNDDFKVISGKPAVLRGDPADFANRNSTTASLQYAGTSEIFLMAGGANLTQLAAFYTMRT